MKKQVKIIIGVVVLLAIAIAVASYFFPKPKGDETSGTIGKADKYRKDQMAAKDIMLRDDILKDTAAVAKTLKQLLQFSFYSVETKKIIDSNWIKPLESNCNDPQCQDIVKILKEYTDFIGNNVPLMKTTNDILADSYVNPKKEMSLDVGFQLYSFVSFIDQFLERDTVLDQAIEKLNQYIATDKSVNTKRKAEIASIKKVRDLMVIDNLLFAVNTGDKKKYDYCACQKMNSAYQVSAVASVSTVNVANPASNPTISSICTTDKVSNVFTIGSAVAGNIVVTNIDIAASGPVINSGVPVVNSAETVKSVFGAAFVQNIGTNNVGYVLNKPIGNVVLTAANFGTAVVYSKPDVLNSADVFGTVFNSSSTVFQSIVSPE